MDPKIQKLFELNRIQSNPIQINLQNHRKRCPIGFEDSVGRAVLQNCSTSRQPFILVMNGSDLTTLLDDALSKNWTGDPVVSVLTFDTTSPSVPPLSLSLSHPSIKPQLSSSPLWSAAVRKNRFLIRPNSPVPSPIRQSIALSLPLSSPLSLSLSTAIALAPSLTKLMNR